MLIIEALKLISKARKCILEAPGRNDEPLKLNDEARKHSDEVLSLNAESRNLTTEAQDFKVDMLEQSAESWVVGAEKLKGFSNAPPHNS